MLSVTVKLVKSFSKFQSKKAEEDLWRLCVNDLRKENTLFQKYFKKSNF